jgi:adenine phosphoribosyltransferase
MNLKNFVIDIPNFPEPGVIFRDITPLFLNPAAFEKAVTDLSHLLPSSFDKLAAVESRGFLFAAPLVRQVKKPLVVIRKPGKLPREKQSVTYNLEYGVATLEIHKDSVEPGEKIVLVDDVLATGGTVEACCRLINSLGAQIISALFFIELSYLNGAERLKQLGVSVQALLTY